MQKQTIQQDDIQDYLDHVVGQIPMREIARRRGVQASTVLRRVTRVEDARDDQGFEQKMLRLEAIYA